MDYHSLEKFVEEALAVWLTVVENDDVWEIYQIDMQNTRVYREYDIGDMESTVVVSLRFSKVERHYSEALCIFRKKQSMPLHVISRPWL